MFIWKNTKLRCNIYAAYIDAQGTQYTRIPAELLEEISDPIPPVDFSDDLYYHNETDDAPYVTWTRKPEEQITQAHNSKVQQQISGLERQAIEQGLVRTIIDDLLIRSKGIAAQAGITEAMLLDPTSPAYSAAYAKVHANDVARADLRKQFK